MYMAKVRVMLKASVLDPQGSAVFKALHSIGYEDVADVRIGKYMEIQLDGTDEQAVRDRIESMCQQLLANTVIESYTYEVEASR